MLDFNSRSLLRLFLSFTLSLGGVSAAMAQGVCRDFLSEAKNNIFLAENTNTANLISELQGEALVTRMERALLEMDSFRPEKPTVEDLKKLKTPSKLMSILKRLQINTSHQSFEFNIWSQFEKKIFNSELMESPEKARQVEQGVFKKYMSIFSDVNMQNQFTLVAKGKMGSALAKQEILAQLQKHAFFFEKVYGQKFKLLEETGWIQFFELSESSQLATRIAENAQLNRALNTRINDSLSTKNSPSVTYRRLVDEFFGAEGVGLKRDARDFLNRQITKKEIATLIQDMRLSESKTQEFLNTLNILEAGTFSQTHSVKLGYVLVLFKAYTEVYGQVSGFTNVAYADRYFSTPVYLGVKMRLNQERTMRAILEERYSEYMERSDALNLRLKNLETELNLMTERFPDALQEVTRAKEELQTLTEINDFNRDLVAFESQLLKVEMRRDELMEQILKNIRNENITDFSDLNLRWQRLIANKEYHLQGVDYNKVRFSQQVIEHFSQNHVVGSRFLTALSKSYVATQNSSGLRRIPNIHADFRDIKVLKSGGKIRIIGRLIGDTIHFFYIYQSDKPYNHKAIEQIVDHYQGN